MAEDRTDTPAEQWTEVAEALVPTTPTVVYGERWSRTEDLSLLTAGLAGAIAEIETPVKDRVVRVTTEKGTYSYSYAELSTVLDAIRKPLAKQGIVVVQHPRVQYNEDGAWVEIESVMLHASGQWMSNLLAARLPDNKPQTLGSLITYLRRYAVQGLVGIATEQDEDGSAAQGVAEQASHQPTQRAGSRPITPAQEKFLLVEMAKAKVGNDALIKWMDAEGGIKITRLAEIPMGGFDAVLAWVRAQAGKREG